MIITLVETNAAGTIEEVSLETLALSRSLAAEGGGIPIRALLCGPVTDQAALSAELGAHGVIEVHHAGGDDFESFSAAAWAAALQQLRAATKSVVVTSAGSVRGNQVLAHLAARLDVPMAANVVSFSGLAPFVVTRQVVGGAALEEMQLGQRPAIFSVAGHSWVATPADAPAAGEWHELSVALEPADLVARVVSTGQKEVDESDSLKSAKIVIGAGRGAGGPDGFGAVAELAEVLGGSLGVSRVVTSLGWRPHHEQVGQTGSRISPDLYVPCGISGAIQHWAGCQSSKVILAVNTDPDAPMMTKATYAVVGDMHEVVPAVVEAVRARKG